MNLFDRMVEQAMAARPGLHLLRAVVEKELLHHEILREMSQAGFLSSLTFIGGTCLRACYGAERLSEDLDFTGGSGFSRDSLKSLGAVLVERLEAKYGLAVSCSEPVKESTNVDTWKLSMVTRPERKMFPAQRIHIDICAVPSYDGRPMMLRNDYGIDFGTFGLILQAESRNEILADKMLALALRPNRIKNRDLWDIVWLKRQGVELPLPLIPRKLADRKIAAPAFLASLLGRIDGLDKEPERRREFVKELQRFLPASRLAETVETDKFWTYAIHLVREEADRIVASRPA